VAQVRIERLRKSFGGKIILDIDEIEIHDGEFFSLLGPSGCGKTTTLRAVAGLVDPDLGRIVIGGRDMTNVPTWQRNLGMVFQKYALFPHLTVGENVAYGLEERGGARAEIARRVSEALTLVALPDCVERYPHQLSGGQQQRVAMARAVVYRPDVLLLDEPLSNLDVQLRVAMRAELKRLQQVLGITTLFVTHDQQEALALSDRVAVMRDGRLEQIGTPEEIYESPRSLFVANFVGAANVLQGVVRGADAAAGTLAIEIAGGGTVSAPSPSSPLAIGRAVKVAVKPERVGLRPGSSAHGGCSGEVESAAYLGSAYSYVVRVGSQRVEARCADAVLVDGRPARAGDPIGVTLARESLRIFDV
jgi:ABC-type Fe3+/spermidine/putrescine transport system ATPase subunit